MLHKDDKSACLDLCNCEQDEYVAAFYKTVVAAFQHVSHNVSNALEVALLLRSVLEISDEKEWQSRLYCWTVFVF
jgi:hypothetical protein